jgi:hypothetical protein
MLSLSQPSLSQPSLKKKIERERCSSLLSKLQQNFKREPLLKIVTNFHLLSLSKIATKERKQLQLYNEIKNSQRRTHTQQVLFAETTIVALILSTQGTKHFAQFCLQRQHSPHRSEFFICLETTFIVLFLSTIAAQRNKFAQFSDMYKTMAMQEAPNIQKCHFTL